MPDVDSIDVDDDTSEGPKALRDALAKAKKQLADLSKEVETFRTEKQKAAISDVVSAAVGDDAKKAARIALMYSGEDQSPEAVTKWLTDNADLFGIDQPAEPSDTAPAAGQVQKVLGQAPQANTASPADLLELYRSGTDEQLLAMGLIKADF